MILSIENLNINFFKNDIHTSVVRDLNMHIYAGEMLGVVGESGSGKSLTNLALMGLLPSSARMNAAKLEFKNRNLLSFSPKDWQSFRGNEIAMIFQHSRSALNPMMKMKDQLAECIKKNKGDLGKKDIMNKVSHLLQQVGLDTANFNVESYPYELSSGVAQRVTIAMALASNPSLLIADEITTGLDVMHKRQILQLLDEIRRERNMAILIVSHDINLIREYTQRMHVMYSGELMESGLTQILMEGPRHPYTKGLVNCLRRESSDHHKQYLNTINGLVLPITEETKGCRFYNRCPAAHSNCLVKPVVNRPIDRLESFVNCHLGDNA